MDKFEQLFSDLKAEQNSIIEELNIKKDELDKKIAFNTEKKKDLEKRELVLIEKEKGFDKRETDVNAKASKLMTEEQLREKNVEVNTLIGINEELLKSAKDERAEAELKMEEVVKRELAVQERERTYEEKIRKQFADKLLK
jgi:hypothetical protein